MGRTRYSKGNAVDHIAIMKEEKPPIVEEEKNEIIQHPDLPPVVRQGGSLPGLTKAMNAIKLPKKKSSTIKFNIL
jgi:hypothetical protein